MKKTNPIRRQVWSQCLRTMAAPIGLSALTEVFTSTLLVITANTLGGFADAALSLNFQLGIENIIVLAVCVILTVAAAPLLGLAANFSLLRQALRHDNIVFGRFFDKDPERALALDSGELQYELEDAPNELRFQMVALVSKALALPFCTAYLLYCAGKISWLLTGIMLVLAALRLIVPALFRGRLAKYDQAENTFFIMVS